MYSHDPQPPVLTGTGDPAAEPSAGVKRRALIVEDNDDDVLIVRELLAGAEPRFELERVATLEAATGRVALGGLDVVLLDLSLPDCQGLDTVRRLHEAAPELPIVVMSGRDDERLAMDAVKQGAQDYLVKGQVEPRFLIRTIAYAVERNRMMRELEHARQQARLLATHDGLTGLPNRTLFYEHLSQGLNFADRYAKHLAVLFIDLDRFKPVNDTLGHVAGDELLQRVGQTLKASIRSSDTAARLGGDEFAILLNDLSEPANAGRVAEKIISRLAAPHVIDGHELSISASIGIAFYPQDASDAETLIRFADEAMYTAKQRGGCSYHFYAPELQHRERDHRDLERELRDALRGDELRVYYQPQIDIRAQRIIGAEALLRWEHPRYGLLYPTEFIPLAEETGLIDELFQWTLDAACLQLRHWEEQGLSDLRAAVNLSACQLRHDGLERVVADTLQRTGVGPERVDLELTESGMMEDVEGSVRRLRRLKELGVRISVDDFGTGHSCLAYLKRFPMDAVKVDRSFVKGLVGDHSDETIIGAILALTASLHLDTIAEGVETREQLMLLRSLGCHRMQGFLFRPPVPQDEFLRFWRRLGRASDAPALVQP